MLEHITWQTYFIAVSAAVIIYYILIGVLYYQKELRGLMLKYSRKQAAYEQGPEAEESTEDHPMIDRLREVVKEIDGLLEQAGTEETKEVLQGQLEAMLAGYEDLSKPAFKVAINNHIIRQSIKLCGVGFSEQELEALWGNLPR